MLEIDRCVYLLFEHKSTPDKKIRKQLLRYMAEILDQHEKQNKFSELVPLIIPIIICHSDRPCNISNIIKPIFAIIEEMEEFVSNFSKCVLDLSEFEPENIEDSKLKMLLLALKHSRKPNILVVLPQIIRISEKVYGGFDDYDYLKVILTYLASVINKSAIDVFWRIVAKEHTDGSVYMETIADELRQEERLKREKIERELQKIIEQKDTLLKQKDTLLEQKEVHLHKIVHWMLKKGISLQSIQKITGLNNKEIENIIKDAN